MLRVNMGTRPSTVEYFKHKPISSQPGRRALLVTCTCVTVLYVVAEDFRRALLF